MCIHVLYLSLSLSSTKETKKGTKIKRNGTRMYGNIKTGMENDALQLEIG